MGLRLGGFFFFFSPSFFAGIPREPAVFWLAYRHTGGACGRVGRVNVWIYGAAHVCFSEWLGIPGVPVVNLPSLSLRGSGGREVGPLGSSPSIHPSICPSPVDRRSSPGGFLGPRCSKHTPLAAHGSRENTVIRPGSDNLNWLCWG